MIPFVIAVRKIIGKVFFLLSSSNKEDGRQEEVGFKLNKIFFADNRNETWNEKFFFKLEKKRATRRNELFFIPER